MSRPGAAPALSARGDCRTNRLRQACALAFMTNVPLVRWLLVMEVRENPDARRWGMSRAWDDCWDDREDVHRDAVDPERSPVVEPHISGQPLRQLAG
jgi:hypothetical protein